MLIIIDFFYLLKFILRSNSECFFTLNEEFKLIHSNKLEKDAYKNLDKRKYQLAIDNFTKLINLNPSRPQHAVYLYKRGQAKSSLKKWDDALIDYNYAIKLKKNCSDYFYERGRAYFYLKKYTKAEKDFNRSEYLEISNNDVEDSIDDRNHEFLYCRGLTYFHLKKYDLASYYLKLTKKSNFQYFYLKGLELYNEGRYELTFKIFNDLQERFFNKCPSLYKDNKIFFKEYFFYLGKTNYLLGQHKSAIEAFNKAEKDYLKNEKLFNKYFKDSFYFQNKKYYGRYGREEFEDQIKVEFLKEFLCFRGKALFHEAKYEEAIKDYDQLIELDSSRPYFFLFRGIAKIEHNKICKKVKSFGIRSVSKDFDKAIQLFLHFQKEYFKEKQAIEQTDWDPEDYDIKGWRENNLCLFKGDIDHAVINLSAYDYYYHRGLSNYYFKKYTKAITDFNRAIELNSKVANIYYFRALTNFKLNNHNEAKIDAKKAISLGEENAWELYDEIKSKLQK